MKLKNVLNENLNMTELLKIRNQYYNKFIDIHDDFVTEFGEKDSKLIPILKAMTMLQNEYEKFLKSKGVL